MAELQLRNIWKSFYGVPVLKDVGFSLEPGRVLGLVGENGSGKSTTMNILGGVHQPDSGSMVLNGEAYVPRNPRDAQARGVAFIHQELNLFPNLSIEENLFIRGFPRLTAALPFINRVAMRARARELIDAVDLKFPPGTPVARLSQGERQLVEIAKALAADARLIIFDEPTTSLTARESERLFEIIARLKGQGRSVIYISHILGDVMRLCDDVVVLRDGQVVGTAPKRELTIERMITLMVGRSIDQLYPPRESAVRKESPILELRGVSQPGTVLDISFALRRGEILGVSGLMGSGRSELARIIFGLDPYAAGSIVVDGKPLPPADPRAAMDAGIAFLTEDRRAEGLLMQSSIADNLALPSLGESASPFLKLLRRTDIGERTGAMARAVQINAKDIDHTLVRTLSGGNQQKVVIGKWLLRRPTVFIMDEPTRGIDVGAKFEVYKMMNRLVVEGASILCISSEIEELIGMCDRIMVMSQGEVKGFRDRAGFDREELLRTAMWAGSAKLQQELA
jgi:ribose transport system ATP-binding protein